MDKIFTQGFTTKSEGHGFGLHSSANYMQSMGGNIEVDSDGEGKGATFTLIFLRST
jgi:signal transduction histidine kinase